MQKLTKTPKNAYFLERINKLGLTIPQAAQNGLKCDDNGAIQQLIPHVDGSPILYIPQFGKKRNGYNKFMRNNAKTPIMSAYEEQLTIIRHTPKQLEENPELGKYKYPAKDYTGIGTVSMPNKAAIEAYNAQTKGGVLCFTEGFIKGVALSLNSIPTFSFSGNSSYKLDDQIKDYLLSIHPEQIVINYDGDALDGQIKDGVFTSSRLQGFYNSAFFFGLSVLKFIERNNLNAKVYFNLVHPDQDSKGIDDLIYNNDKSEVLKAFHTFQSSDYFIFERLFKTSIQRSLEKYFKLLNHKDFYNQYADQIGENKFRFKGLLYQPEKIYNNPNLFESSEYVRFFRLLNNPHNVEIEKTVIEVNKYLSEKTTELIDLLQSSKKIAIDAPTGSAKTSFFIGYKNGSGKKIKGYFQKNNVLAVIAVPYKSLAKQLGKNTNAVVLTGSITNRKKEQALNSQLVICTYDNLHHVTDIVNRVLVIDEAHNLINHYGELVRRKKAFRAKTLRRVLSLSETAKQTILLSGTMPKLFCKELGFKYVQIERKDNPKVNLLLSESEKQTPEALTKAFLAIADKIDLDDGKIRTVLFDNIGQLEEIKKTLVKSGKLKNNEIEIISRGHIESKRGSLTYSQVIKKGIIKGVKLILTTCLLAEGISIKNKNVGQLFAVGVKCPDKFRQFVARFRSMQEINVHSILMPRHQIKKEWKVSAQTRIKGMEAVAVAQLKVYQLESDYLKTNYPDDVTETGESVHFDLLAINDGVVVVDTLKIFATIREENILYSNNAFFYHQILEDKNFQIKKVGGETLTGKTAAILQKVSTDRKAEKKAAYNTLQMKLDTNPAEVVQAYHTKLKKSGNRKSIALIEETAADLLENPIQSNFLNDYYIYFSDKHYTKIIRAYLRLRFTGIDQHEITKILDDQTLKNYSRIYKSINQSALWIAYQNRTIRNKLNVGQQIDAKIYNRIAKKINEAADDSGRISKLEAQKIINSTYKVSESYDPEALKLRTLSKVITPISKAADGSGVVSISIVKRIIKELKKKKNIHKAIIGAYYTIGKHLNKLNRKDTSITEIKRVINRIPFDYETKESKLNFVRLKDVPRMLEGLFLLNEGEDDIQLLQSYLNTTEAGKVVFEHLPYSAKTTLPIFDNPLIFLQLQRFF